MALATLSVRLCASAIAMVTSTVGFGLTVARFEPGAGLSKTLSVVLPLADVELNAGESALRQGGGSSRAEAEIHFERALKVAPDRISTVVAVILDSAAIDEHVSPNTIRLLEKTYALEPLSYSYGVKRLAFMLDRWDQLNVPLRISAMREIKMLWTTDQRAALTNMCSRISNKSGWLAAFLTIRDVSKAAPPEAWRGIL